MTMKTKHTPGPWSITCNRVHGAVDSGANTGIADMLGNCGVTATVNANAKLIAAAPELLAALAQVAALLSQPVHMSNTMTPNAINILRADTATARLICCNAFTKATK